MMDLSKSYDFFQPEKVKGKIHIVGCGSVGSTVATLLAKSGITSFTLWDFDTVEKHNLVNQMYREKDVGQLKVEALKDVLTEINSEIEVTLKPNGWENSLMSGYVFLTVDNIELRKKIVEAHMNTPYVKAMFDFRTLLESAQHYAADWSDKKSKTDFLSSMQFSHDEAKEETPTSACGVTLGVATTVTLVSSVGVNNFIRFVKGEKLWKFAQIDGFHGIFDCFES